MNGIEDSDARMARHAEGRARLAAARAAAGPGVGHHLAAILARAGLAPRPGCACKALAAQLDRMGPDACAARIGELAGALADRARRGDAVAVARRGRLLLRLAAAAPPAAMLGAWLALGLAIRRARRPLVGA